ncbi:MAG: hypothetical protein LBU81_05805 [Methanosarcinales archaeon]|nr:hypothetical protein [Methanosarcinales archaeon]
MNQKNELLNQKKELLSQKNELLNQKKVIEPKKGFWNQKFKKNCGKEFFTGTAELIGFNPRRQ